MKLGRFLTRLVKVAAGATAAKQLLDTASTCYSASGTRIKVGAPTAPRILQGPYRSAVAQHPPTCTSCEKVVVLWCRLCGAPIELGEPVFCPRETGTMKAASVRAGQGAEIVGVDAVEATALYDIALPKEHVHRQCAFVHTTQIFTQGIIDITKG